MRIRLASLLEWGAVLAPGMAAVSWAVTAPGAAAYVVDSATTLHRARYVIEPFLSGTALAGGIALWWETMRRESPPTWGIGRWTWAVAALAVAFTTAAWGTIWASALARRTLSPPAVEMAWRHARSGISATFYPQMGWVFLAAWITSRIARRPIDPAPDAREWAGRALLIAIVSWTVAYHMVVALF